MKLRVIQPFTFNGTSYQVSDFVLDADFDAVKADSSKRGHCVPVNDDKPTPFNAPPVILPTS